MAWIQGGKGSYWWQRPNWDQEDWMMKLDEYGTLVLMIKKRVPAKSTLEKAGFVGVKIKSTDEEARLEGWVVYHVTVSDLVPAPKHHMGSSSIHPGFETIVIDFRIKLCEANARDLWIKGKELDLRIKKFFGNRRNAKHKLRKAFAIKDKQPGMFPVLTTGLVWVNKKGELT